MPRVIDLSYPIEDHFRWGVDRTLASSFENGDSVQVTQLAFRVHGFTHIDSPRHILPDAPTTSSFDMNSFVGHGAIIDISGLADNTTISAEALADAGTHVQPADIVIIKAAWGGKSLFRDFLPPSGKKPSDAFIQALEDKAKKKKKPFSKEEYMKGFGHYYRLMMASVDETLSNLKTYAPNYKGQGYEIVGFVWFQGYNDKFSDHSTSTYQENMAHFIRDVRKDLKSPKLPFVIGAMGHNGTAQKGTTKILADAQIATAQMPEFKGNVITVKTADFWDYDAEKAFKNKKEDADTWAKLGSNKGYHYFGSAAFFEKTGTAFAESIIELGK